MKVVFPASLGSHGASFENPDATDITICIMLIAPWHPWGSMYLYYGHALRPTVIIVLHSFLSLCIGQFLLLI